MVEILRRPGDFAFGGDDLLRVQITGSRLTQEQEDGLRGTVSLGRVRTSSQDVRYGVNQLTEIAARVLSPGINDPFTAMTCMDWMVDALAVMAHRGVPRAVRLEASGQGAILEEQTGFSDVLALTFGPLRFYARDDAPVTACLLAVLARLAHYADTPEARRALAEQAGSIATAAGRNLKLSADRAAVAEALKSIVAALEQEQLYARLVRCDPARRS